MSEILLPGVEIDINTYSSWGVIPMDAYNPRLSQFVAMQQLGYPVALERHPADILPQGIYENEKYEDWVRSQYPTLARPVLLNDEFGPYIEDPDELGVIAYTQNRRKKEIFATHLASVAWDIERGFPGAMKDRLENANSALGELEDFDRFSEKREEIQFLERGFMAAYERMLDKKSNGYPLPENGVSRSDATMLHSDLQNEGIRPASPEELGALWLDYYKLYEKYIPGFKDFKSPDNSL